MTTPTEMQSKVDKTVTNMDRLDDFVNGGPTTDVTLDSGVVPSVQKMVAESGLAAGNAAAAAGSASAAAGSADDAAGSASAAANTLVSVNSAGTTQITALQDEGTTQIAAVNDAGAIQTANAAAQADRAEVSASSIAALASTLTPTVTYGDNTGPTANASTASDRGLNQIFRKRPKAVRATFSTTGTGGSWIQVSPDDGSIIAQQSATVTSTVMEFDASYFSWWDATKPGYIMWKVVTGPLLRYKTITGSTSGINRNITTGAVTIATSVSYALQVDVDGDGISQVMAAVLSTAAPNGQPIVLPSAFALCPIKFAMLPDGRIQHNYTPGLARPIVKPSLATAVYYVDEVNGLDTNNGTTPTTPYKSLVKALDNVTGDIWIWLMSDCSTLATSGVGATLAFTSCVIEPYIKSSVTVSARLPSSGWALVSGTTATYETTVTGTALQVFDEGVPLDGIASRLTASSATTELPAGSRKITGSTVRVRTADSRAPDASIKIMAGGIHFNLVGTTGRKLWIDRVNVEGGQPFYGTNTGAMSYVWWSNANLKYGTVDDLFHNYGRCISILYKVQAQQAQTDGFGYSGLFGGLFIELDCGGKRCGTTNIDNVSTGHAGSKIIRADTGSGSMYVKSGARPIHDIDNGLVSLNMGITAGASLSSATYQGASFAVGLATSVSDAQMYLLNCKTASGSTEALSSGLGTAAFNIYNFDRAGAPDYLSPIINNWWPFA